ncbi:MAG TPA: multifunctional CCA tRNA nucleotidyl transferase/2'3'-cyclic phosphodiesterase/2'nucleotidase/phosphatase [Steroidobacteraceae bacterium]|jgi:tRNA nucleotidyltransferase (CCA-adding enzyme)|nr:multifunctional CCA tRNA nucleotidyl transferase/2'3'-cyclic phosphodiesterase/2'nucleotidase/phosphatase [Steroidobacteraceae bacterium]
MELYLVGGAVRDELLGRPVAERDWVVVGATPQEMEQRGFRAVGRDFPVYLHPQTHEEYALARLERKVGPGYRGFTTQSSPDVTLEQDLQRRDLTINAIARASDGRLIDPFDGRRDLEQRVLRHVSAAFVEDPVRILRVARFAARFAALGFTVAPETRVLMRQMVDNGEVRALVPERLWRELERALGEPQPPACFDTLQDCGALPVLMPELAWREHERRALQAAVSLSADPTVRFAALLADIDVAAIGSLCDRLRVPNDYRELAVLGARLSASLAQAWHLEPGNLLRLFETADAFRRPDRFAKLLLAAQADEQARSQAPSQGAWKLLPAALAATAAVVLPAEQLAALKGNGPGIAAALRAARLARLEALLQAH